MSDLNSSSQDFSKYVYSSMRVYLFLHTKKIASLLVTRNLNKIPIGHIYVTCFNIVIKANNVTGLLKLVSVTSTNKNETYLYAN